MFGIVAQKQCNQCKVTKPVTEFHKHKDCIFGVVGTCKACASDKGKQWAANNREKVKEIRRRWTINHPGVETEYKRRNRYRYAERERAWKLKNPDKAREMNRTRRARIKGSDGKITTKEWNELCETYGNKCLRCGRADLKLTLDHVVPLVLGGANIITNAQPLCRTCNSIKGIKVIDYR